MLIDADIIVTRSLRELIARAEGHRSWRSKTTWTDGYPSGASCWGSESCAASPTSPRGSCSRAEPLGERVLGLMDRLADEVHPALTVRSGGDPSYPFHYPEQDLLNAVLASRLEPEQTQALPFRLVPYPPFPGVGVLEERTLRCGYGDGTQTFALHHFGTKPWMEPARDGPYSACCGACWRSLTWRFRSRSRAAAAPQVGPSGVARS